jgi:excisionase family DNA binding protein
MQQSYLSVNDFAKMMKVSEVTIRRAIQKGRINAFRVGAGKRSPFRIPFTEVERIQMMSHEEIMKNFG